MEKRMSHANLPTSFLQKTFEMVNNEALSRVVGWCGDGHAFVIRDVSEFTDTVLPQYFKHSNYASFVCQLNMYDFHKCRVDGLENAFIQPLFRRDSRHLLSEIRRKVSDNSCSLVPVAAAKSETQSILEKLLKLKSTQDDLKQDLERLQHSYDSLSTQNVRLVDEISTARERENKFEKVLVVLANWLQNPQKQIDASTLFGVFDAKTLLNEDFGSKQFFLPDQLRVREVDEKGESSPLMLTAPDDDLLSDLTFDEMLS